MAAIFELEQFPKLPLWAQVLMASRLVRRAVLHLPADVPAEPRATLLAACDAMDRCAEHGAYLKDEQPAIHAGANFPNPSRALYGAVNAAYYAADAAHAAHDSLDFSAAESACSSSVSKAIDAAGTSTGLNPLQVRVFAAIDFDLLRFSCEESRIGRYDGLGQSVLQRLVPVNPPDSRDARSPHPMDGDPTGGAR